jgi:hypothetical protein
LDESLLRLRYKRVMERLGTAIASPKRFKSDPSLGSLTPSQQGAGTRSASATPNSQFQIESLQESPESPELLAARLARQSYNRSIYTPSMEMPEAEVALRRSQMDGGTAARATSEYGPASVCGGGSSSTPGWVWSDPSEVSFVPFQSSRAAYNQTVFSPSMGVTAEELAAMRLARGRRVSLPASDAGGEEGGLETRPAAAPVRSFRAVYNRLIHSPSMGITEDELHALQIAAQSAPPLATADLPAPAGTFGVVPVARFRSLYRKVATAAADTPPGPARPTEEELAALRVAACIPDGDEEGGGGEGCDDRGAGDDSSLEWQVGVVPMSTCVPGGTPLTGMRAGDGQPSPGECTAEMLVRWAVHGQDLFAGDVEAALRAGPSPVAARAAAFSPGGEGRFSTPGGRR